MKIKIKKLCLKDASDAAAIERECFSHPWSEKALEDELKNPFSIALAAEADGGVRGYITASNIDGEVFINNIAVSENYRRMGIGRELLLALEAHISNKSFITLEVRQSNFAAISLYSKMGYKKTGLRKDFYRDPRENAIIMTKDF